MPETTTPAIGKARSEAVAPSQTGELRVTHPTRGYAVTRNPFAIWSVLPATVLAFAGLAVWEFIGDYHVLVTDRLVDVNVTVVVFLIVSLGILLIPAVTLKGSINLTHDGVTFERGKHHLTAAWEQVEGLSFRHGVGLCLVIRDPVQTTPRIKLPGGFRAEGGRAQIPLRMFGDRRYSIIYDVRDRVPEANWQPALSAVSTRSGRRILMVYGLTTLVSCLAMIAVAYALTH